MIFCAPNIIKSASSVILQSIFFSFSMYTNYASASAGAITVFIFYFFKHFTMSSTNKFLFIKFMFLLVMYLLFLSYYVDYFSGILFFSKTKYDYRLNLAN